MPRFPEKNLGGVVFMYRTVGEANSRARLGGTGFLVGRAIPNSENGYGQQKYLPYLITNRHVAFEASACVGSVNRRDGGPPDVWDIDQNDWVSHPAGDDLAATCVFRYLDHARHAASFIQESAFVTPGMIASHDIGIGDDVFMVGRFVNHQGVAQNEPALRFGNISVGLTSIATSGPKGPRPQESFAVEMRSRTGFSGAPVCVYRTGQTLAPVPEDAQRFWGLLGVNGGYVLDENGENTFLNGVVPAWKITELLETPTLRAQLDRHAEVAALGDKAPPSVIQSLIDGTF